MAIRCALIIVACLSCLGCRATGPSGNRPAAVPVAGGPAAQDQVVVAYYFHRTFRCYSCSAMEAAILDVMNEHFARQMQEGRVVWTPVNIEDPATQPLQQKLEVRSNGLVLARIENGVCEDSKRMDALGGLMDHPDAFSQFLVNEINSRLSPMRDK